MSSSLTAGYIIWSSVKPTLRIFWTMFLGYTTAKRGILGPKESRVIAYLYINILFPSLIFSRTVLGLNSENISVFPYMIFCVFFYVTLGALFGYAVVKLFRPPRGIQYTIVAASMFTNVGDFPIALALALGDHPPFSPGDSAAAVGYVSMGITIYTLLIFVIGFQLVGRDYVFTETMKRLKADEDAKRAADILAVADAVDAAEAKSTVSNTSDSSVVELTDLSSSGQQEPAAVAPSSTFNFARRRASSKAAVLPDLAATLKDNEDLNNITVTTVVTTNSSAPFVISTTDTDSIIGNSTTQTSNKIIKSWTDKTLTFLRQVFPPQFPILNIVACICGLLVGAVPALKKLFLNPDCGTLQSECTPLGWFYDILVFVGNASVPISLLNLGAALGQMKGFRTGVPMMRAILPTTLMKLVVMPVVSIPIIQALTGIWIPRENKMLRFILMFDSAVPVANLVVAIAQLVSPTGEASDAAALALMQYLVSAVTMTLSVAVILWILGQG